MNLEWSGDARQTHDVNVGMSGDEFRLLKGVSRQFSDELEGPAIKRNQPVHQIIRGVINGSLDSDEVDTPVETDSPSLRAGGRDTTRKTKVSLSDEEYHLAEDVCHQYDLHTSEYNRRPLARKIRQKFLTDFITEVKEQ